MRVVDCIVALAECVPMAVRIGNGAFVTARNRFALVWRSRSVSKAGRHQFAPKRGGVVQLGEKKRVFGATGRVVVARRFPEKRTRCLAHSGTAQVAPIPGSARQHGAEGCYGLVLRRLCRQSIPMQMQHGSRAGSASVADRAGDRPRFAWMPAMRPT